MHILAADIGGTNARFALASCAPDAVRLDEVATYRAAEFPSLGDAAHAFVTEKNAVVERACFAVAGPVTDNEIAFTNSPWRFRQSAIAQDLGLKACRVVNDFYALAAGVKWLADDGFEIVRPGVADKSAPQLVLGPGTGLGQALIAKSADRSLIIPTEGGHAAFAPITDDEAVIVREIARIYPRVTAERLLSGAGLFNIYKTICASKGLAPSLSSPEEVTMTALSDTDDQARSALSFFCLALGRVAGDAVLATGARGGVVLGGGILPKIKDFFLESEFDNAFVDKGLMSNYVKATPVRMIVADHAALYGAAALAG